MGKPPKLKLSDLKRGMEIENIAVCRDTKKFGLILRIEIDKKLPIIIGFETPKRYVEYHTDLAHHKDTWKLTGQTKDVKSIEPLNTSTKNKKK